MRPARSNDAIPVLLLSLNVLRKLQRPLREKIGLAVLVGFFCPLSAVLRIAKLSKSPDFSFVIGWIALWGAVETCVTIVVGWRARHVRCGQGAAVARG